MSTENTIGNKSYEELFSLVNEQDDIEVCKNARQDLYKLISLEFLKNYLKDDIFDDARNESFEIFKFLYDYIKDDPFTSFLKTILINDDTNYSLEKVWYLLEYEEWTLTELSQIILNCSNPILVDKVWAQYLNEVNYNLNVDGGTDDFDEIYDTLFKLCINVKNEIFITESWRLLRDNFNLGTDEIIRLVLDQTNPEIAEFAWHNLLIDDLGDDELFTIASESPYINIAMAALDEIRKRKIKK